MAKFNEKISSLISSQLPDFVVDDHPQFVQFLKTYFQFMESAMLQVTSIENTDGITLENETGLANNLLLDGTKITSEITINKQTFYAHFATYTTIHNNTCSSAPKSGNNRTNQQQHTRIYSHRTLTNFSK